jgi:hypothetical protein
MTHPDRGFLVNNTDVGCTFKTCQMVLPMQAGLTHSTYLVTPHRPIRPIGHPPCAVPPVPTDETTAQSFCIALTTFEWKIESLHIFLKLRADGHRPRHCSERQCVRLTPSRRLAVACKRVVSLTLIRDLQRSIRSKDIPFNKVR